MNYKILLRILCWINAWADLLEAIIAIISFGFYWPRIGITIRGKTSRVFMKYRTNKNNE